MIRDGNSYTKRFVWNGWPIETRIDKRKTKGKTFPRNNIAGIIIIHLSNFL